MKVLKGLGIFLLSFAMVILIVSVSITSAVKDVVQDQLVGEAVKEVALKNVEKNENIDKDLVNQVSDFKGTGKVIDAVLDEYIEYIDKGNKEVSDKTLDLIINFVVDNKDSIEKISGEKVDLEKVKSAESRENLKKSLEESFEKVNGEELGAAKSVVNSYAKVTSNKYKFILIGVIVGLAILIGLICWSVYKWMQPIGIVAITSGIIVTFFYLAVKLIIKAVNANADTHFNINANSILITGIIELVIGIALLVAYTIIDKKIKTKEIYEKLSVKNSNEKAA